MQIDRILKPCAACGESLVFGHFAPQGDVLRLSEGWSRVRCPACRTLGPVRASFRDACDAWDAIAPVPNPALAQSQPHWPVRRDTVAAPRGWHPPR